jgi:hypothetical protein
VGAGAGAGVVGPADVLDPLAPPGAGLDPPDCVSAAAWEAGAGACGAGLCGTTRVTAGAYDAGGAYGAGAGTTGIGGGGGAVSVTCGACARAWLSALTEPGVGYVLFGLIGAGASDNESVTTGILRTPRRSTRR